MRQGLEHAHWHLSSRTHLTRNYLQPSVAVPERLHLRFDCDRVGEGGSDGLLGEATATIVGVGSPLSSASSRIRDAFEEAFGAPATP